MFEVLASSDWAGPLLLLLLWLFIVRLAFWTLDRLFPRIERIPDDRAHLRSRPDPVVAAAVPPATGRREPVQERSDPTVSARDTQTTANQTAPPPTPNWLDTYWRANRRITGILLAGWFLVSLPLIVLIPLPTVVPATSGASLLRSSLALPAISGVFVFGILVIFGYAWRMADLDRIARPGLSMIAMTGGSSIQIGRLLRMVLSFVLVILVIGLYDLLFDLPLRIVSWMVVIITIAIYVGIGWHARATTLAEYCVANRHIPGRWNGLATAAMWVSSAFFVSLAGDTWVPGEAWFAAISGWIGGYVLLALLFAPYLRKSGQYTIADFVGLRYEGVLARIIAALATLMIAFPLMTAQLMSMGIIANVLLGIPYLFGVVTGVVVLLVSTWRGGMQALHWTQVAQGLILFIAAFIPLIWVGNTTLMSFSLTAQTDSCGWMLEITPGGSSIWNTVAFTLCLMCGTASMPHLLMRSYTVASVRESRSSPAWALIVIGLIGLGLPVYSIFFHRSLIGLPVDQDVRVSTGIPEEQLVKMLPDLTELPATVVALIAAGGVAAALAAAGALLLVMSTTIMRGHRPAKRVPTPITSQRWRSALPQYMSVGSTQSLRFMRSTMLVVALLVAVTALPHLSLIAHMVAWSFSLAAATLFPVLVLGIFWKRASSPAAIMGMISGMAATAIYITLNYINPEINLLQISHYAAGIFGIPVNFFVTWAISRFGFSISPQTSTLVDSWRYP